MKVAKSTLLLAALATTIVSCSKNDDDKPTASIEGEYTMVGLSAQTFVGTAAHYPGSTDVDSSVTVSSYATTAASGTIVITAKTFESKKLGYTVSGTATGAMYANGIKQEESSSPFDMVVPESEGTSEYQLIGTDSIYSSKGFVSSPIYGETPVASQPAGAKYSWKGDTLILTSSLRLVNKQTVNGMTINSDVRVKSVIRMKKK